MDQRTRNRNNRKRGSKFEKSVADILDMDVVPYSGSNARFGFGDIRDSVWLGECKNITIKDGRCKIQTEWIKDNRNKSKLYGLLPFLAWMPSGRAEKYIILEPDIFTKLNRKCYTLIEIPKVSRVAVNLFINITDRCMGQVRAGKEIVRLQFGTDDYYMMEIGLFKSIIMSEGLKGVKQTYG